MAAQPTITHALSFDIEDWFHMVGIEAVADPEKWDELPSIVVDRTKWIVNLLREHDTRATFFILGWVAEKHPELVRAIDDAGHEIGTHSHWHRKVYELTPDEFSADMKRSIDAIAGVTGKPVRGFRAPSFSITPGSEWAMDVLLDLGITYDTSLFPAPRGHGGYPCPREIHDFACPSGRVMPEMPISIMKIGPADVCFSGGGYVRLLPSPVIARGFRACEKQGMPVVVYLHPRDFEPDCPRVPMSLPRKFKCYVGLRSTEGKLRRMLRSRRFDTCESVMAGAGVPPLHLRDQASVATAARAREGSAA